MKKNKMILAFAAAIITCSCVYAHMVSEPEEMIAYKVEVDQGDTVWSLCSKIVTDDEYLSRVVWETMKENGIEKADHLQPGELLMIRVPKKGTAERKTKPPVGIPTSLL